MSEQYRLTQVELELMEILWSLGKGTVHEVMAELPANRKLAYTSVSTMLRILQKKNIVTAKKTGRQHIYQPRLNKKTFDNHSIKTVVKQVFSGQSAQMVAYLVDKSPLSVDDINAIQELLNAKKKELEK